MSGIVAVFCQVFFSCLPIMKGRFFTATSHVYQRLNTRDARGAYIWANTTVRELWSNQVLFSNNKKQLRTLTSSSNAQMRIPFFRGKCDVCAQLHTLIETAALLLRGTPLPKNNLWWTVDRQFNILFIPDTFGTELVALVVEWELRMLHWWCQALCGRLYTAPKSFSYEKFDSIKKDHTCVELLKTCTYASVMMVRLKSEQLIWCIWWQGEDDLEHIRIALPSRWWFPCYGESCGGVYKREEVEEQRRWRACH